MTKANELNVARHAIKTTAVLIKARNKTLAIHNIERLYEVELGVAKPFVDSVEEILKEEYKND